MTYFERVTTNVGLVYRWMHGINTRYLVVSKNLPNRYQANIRTWWVSQDERIFVYPSYYLGQYHPNTILPLGWIYLGLRFLGWYIEPNGIETKESSNTCTLPVSNRCKKSLYTLQVATAFTWTSVRDDINMTYLSGKQEKLSNCKERNKDCQAPWHECYQATWGTQCCRQCKQLF